MGYTQVALEHKLLEMYPEIARNGISIGIEFDQDKGAWVVKFQKGGHKRYAFLDKKDADSCMDGNSCIYLGFLIGQYVSDLQKELKGEL